MPLAILAGLPRDRFAAKFGDRHQIGDWDIHIVYSPTPQLDARKCVKDIRAKLKQAPGEGAHIFAIQDPPPPINDRIFLQDDVCGVAHRMTWVLPSDVHGALESSNNFWVKFQQTYLRFEERWRSSLRPRGLNDALILPQCSFTYRCSQNRCFWDRVRLSSPHYDTDVDKIAAVIAVFKRERRVKQQPAYWDDRRLFFKFRGERHGRERIPAIDTQVAAEAVLLRRHKFTYYMDEQFHYDVSRADRSEFQIQDATGVQRRAKNRDGSYYVNLSAYGYIVEKKRG